MDNGVIIELGDTPLFDELVDDSNSARFTVEDRQKINEVHEILCTLRDVLVNVADNKMASTMLKNMTGVDVKKLVKG